MKPRYSPDFTFGNILVITGLLINAGVMSIPRDSEVKTLQKDVERHERLLEQITTSQNLLSANLQTLTAIFNEHAKHPTAKP